MTPSSVLLRHVLCNASFCGRLPVTDLDAALLRQIVDITGIPSPLLLRVARSISKTGNMDSLKLLLSSDAIPKAPGLRYQVKIHSHLLGANQSRQRASQGATLLVSSGRGQFALTITVKIARTAATAKGERRLAKVQWRWFLLTPTYRQVRHQAFMMGRTTPMGIVLASAA